MIDVRSSTCQYHDNLAIFNTIQSNNRYEKIYAPRRNIGTSRLLLSNVPEITEHEDTTDNCPIADTVFRRNKLRRTSMTKKFMNKRRGNQIRWKDNLSSCSIDSVSNANVSVRLRGGTDFFRTPMKTKICNSNNCCVFHSTRTQKPIIPREQTRIVYRNLQNFVDGKETKTLPRQFTRFQKEKQNVEQSKTLKSVGKLTILLLYLHFLLSYYLSFSKTQRFEELFEICETETKYE